MIKPQKLNKGDKVAAITLSWGGAGQFPHRFDAGRKQLEETFGIEVIPTKYALRSPEWIYQHPQARAEDLMQAFEDSSIKAIITTIGGDDSIRTLPFINFSIIRKHPKIFLGLSDSTITHFCCLKAGIVSFYGSSLMVGFAENGGMLPYFVDSVKKMLFSAQAPGQIQPNYDGWTNEFLDWSTPANQQIKRKLEPSTGWQFIQGSGRVQGKLIGGCLEVLEFMKNTSLWPEPNVWKDAIFFIETSEMMPSATAVKYWLRNYGAQGILQDLAGIIVGRPYKNYANNFIENYDEILLQVIRNECGLTQLPIITHMDFGHTEPGFIIPYGVLAEIDCSNQTFSILESACV